MRLVTCESILFAELLFVPKKVVLCYPVFWEPTVDMVLLKVVLQSFLHSKLIRTVIESGSTADVELPALALFECMFEENVVELVVLEFLQRTTLPIALERFILVICLIDLHRALLCVCTNNFSHILV